jgi:26S proteasome regulatory subunit T1
VTYDDIGGSDESIEKLREVVEMPLLHPERFVSLGIDPPKGVLLYGPPGTGKTLSARAVANRTDACFIRVIGSELVQKYVGEGARMVRELFQMARSKKACIIFFDEIDSIGGTRFGGGGGGNDNEVSRTMLEIVNQLDGFDPRGNVKVLMATNRPDTLDPALMRPGRLDRKIEFGLPGASSLQCSARRASARHPWTHTPSSLPLPLVVPMTDLKGRTKIFKIHCTTMNCDRGIRYELLARLCPNTTGAEIRSVTTEAGMFAIRARRKSVSETDLLDAVNKVVKGYSKFSATPKYMTHN